MYVDHLPNHTASRNTIGIAYELVTTPGVEVVIPVLYTLVFDKVARTNSVYCDIDLLPENVPAWLSGASFVIVNDYKTGLYIMNYNNSSTTNIETEGFRRKLYKDIMRKEKISGKFW